MERVAHIALAASVMFRIQIMVAVEEVAVEAYYLVLVYRV
jgi:hypothetical protein